MADVERIAPPVPTLPPPVGRGVGTRRQPRPSRNTPTERPPAERTPADERKDDRDAPEHIDEYV
jgi:hypothetical protein